MIQDKFSFLPEKLEMVAFDSDLKLSLGEVVVTPGAAQKLPSEDIAAAVHKHAHGNWGDLDFGDSQLNDLRLLEGGTIASIYRASNCVKFYVITESDRSL